MGGVISFVAKAATAVWSFASRLMPAVGAVIAVISGVKDIVRGWLNKPQVYEPLQKETQNAQELVTHKKGKQELEEKIEKLERDDPEAKDASDEFMAKYGKLK
jgi:hypothetical protein